MTDLKKPTTENPSVIIPIHPAIENYMRGLVGKTDDPVLLTMEELARQKNFPIVNRLVGIFLEMQDRKSVV